MEVVGHQATSPHGDPFAPEGLMQKIAIKRRVVAGLPE